MNSTLKLLFFATIFLSCCFSQIPLKRKISNLISIEGSIPLINYEDYNYYTVFEFGSPAQKVELIQDTWVGETWINLANSTYNLSASQTANVSTATSFYNYTFGAGTVTGHNGTEIISINAINLTNLRIPLLFGENGTGRGLTYPGSIGLANYKEYQNWLEVAVSEGLLSDSVFAFDLKNYKSNSYFYAGSASFPTGAKSSQLTWFPVLTDHYWSMGTFTGTVFDGVTYSQGQTYYKSKLTLDKNAEKAVWDSGFAITYIGPTAFEAFAKLPSVTTNCQYNPKLYMYICTCAGNFPDITLNTPQMNFKALAKDYMFELQGGYCVLGIATNSETWVPFMVFGDGMFRNYIVAYDKAKGRIGFSQDKTSQTEKQQSFLSK